MNNSKIEPRAIHSIASEIQKEWKNIYFGAVPYLNAMKSLSSVSDRYYEDSSESIVTYFLANAQTFRGEKARELKTELKNLFKTTK